MANTLTTISNHQQNAMKLGKRFSRHQRSWNAKASFTLTMKDGTVIKPHRKLNMMLVLSFGGGINKKALKKEADKLMAKMNYKS